MQGQIEMKKYLSAVIMLIILCGLAATGRAKISHKDADLSIPAVSPMGHEALRADIVNDKLSSFTIDVQQFANISASENAPTYAIYTKTLLPSACGDFSDKEVPYWTPSKYKRTFDLRGHKDVVEALETYGCIIVKSNQSQAEKT